ncbi:MAG: hypothetical protein JXA78_09890 [Anaerolineales bacterium]|nr:hypothetical protein [Anaerolineales bacterium]
MTTLIQQSRQCLVCDAINEYVEVVSTNQLGNPDLDTRPPEMLRSTIPYWIQCCPSCGYCAPQVSVGPEEAREIVRSNAYLKQLGDPSYPPLADHFLCWAMIQEACGELADAGWACVHAAWACDDEGASMGASLCRMKAIEHFLQARRRGARFAEPAGVEDVLLADLYRRCGEFERAVTMVQVGVLKRPAETLRKVLYYQVKLVMQCDAAKHTIDEVLRSEAK